MVFFTQSCSVNSIYFHTHEKFIELAHSKYEYLLYGLPKLTQGDFPTFLYKYGSYPGYFDIVVNQFDNIGKADLILANSIYELEKEVVDWLVMIWPLKTIGPSIPSMLLDKILKQDKEYGINLSNPNTKFCFKWLNDKPKGSIVYVSFGNMASLSENQTHKVVRCFMIHYGWNSTLEALSIGVPLIVMSLWTDQVTNAKLNVDVWKIGVRVVAGEKEEKDNLWLNNQQPGSGFTVSIIVISNTTYLNQGHVLVFSKGGVWPSLQIFNF